MAKFKVEESQLVRQVWTYEVEAENEKEALHKAMEKSDYIDWDVEYTIENDYSEDFEYSIVKE
jgi:hypothetical protein